MSITPQDVWDFAFSREYTERYAYIESLPEEDREVAATLLHYFDLTFRLTVERERADVHWDCFNGDPEGVSEKVGEIREYAYTVSNPSNSEPWREKYAPEKFKW